MGDADAQYELGCRMRVEVVGFCNLGCANISVNCMVNSP